MQKIVKRWLVGLGGATLIACGPAQEGGAGHAEEQPHESGTSALAAQGEVLALGATGAEVQAVHHYLTEFGYLPNAALQREYPQWRSPVSSAPVRNDVYDERTAEAVRAFQRSFGLPESGMVDDASRGIMVQARCGVPDMADPDDSNKWDITANDWSSTDLTWRLMHTNGQCEVNAMAGCMNQAQAEAAITAAFATWQGPSRHTFTKTTGAAVIEIRFKSTRANGTAWGAALAHAYLPADGGDVTINSNQYFSGASPTPGGYYDLQSVLVHELGHSLGIHHTSVISPFGGATPIMYPTPVSLGMQNRALQPDDRVAAMAKGLSWQSFDSTSFDIDVDDGPTWQHIYVTATPAVPGGYTVWRLENNWWSILEGQGALRIASNGGTPWIVQDDGDIFQWNWGTLSWSQRPGCAIDVAVGGDNSVWVIGCNQGVAGNRIYKWNGNSWDADFNDVGGVRITVGPRAPGGEHHPWVVRSDGHVIRRNSGNIFTGAWHFLPGPTTLGTDIAASPAGNVWMIGNTPRGGGFPIYVWNEQSALAVGEPGPVKQARWVGVQGGAVNVTVDRLGVPYVVNNANYAFYVK
jgi:peptidoglycan hydrolase-like protein with peptidoglycan-binding domain